MALTALNRDAREARSGHVMDVWSSSSFLPRLTARMQEALLDRATVRRIDAGDLVNERHAGAAPHLVLVLDGLLRTFRQAMTRQVTVRYVAPGDVQGLAETIRPSAPMRSQALTDSQLLILDHLTFRSLMQRDSRDAWIVAEELVALNHQAVELLSENVFLPVRQRVARHLLELAVREGDRIVVPATAADVAHAIGSVREVVARVLQGLKEDGLLAGGGQHFVLCDPAGMHTAAMEAADKSHARQR